MEGIDAEKVMLWYEGADISVPERIGREIAGELKNVVLNEDPGKTHLTIFDHHGEETLIDMLKD